MNLACLLHYIFLSLNINIDIMMIIKWNFQWSCRRRGDWIILFPNEKRQNMILLGQQHHQSCLVSSVAIPLQNTFRQEIELEYIIYCWMRMNCKFHYSYFYWNDTKHECKSFFSILIQFHNEKKIVVVIQILITINLEKQLFIINIFLHIIKQQHIW